MRGQIQKARHRFENDLPANTARAAEAVLDAFKARGSRDDRYLAGLAVLADTLRFLIC